MKGATYAMVSWMVVLKVMVVFVRVMRVLSAASICFELMMAGAGVLQSTMVLPSLSLNGVLLTASWCVK